VGFAQYVNTYYFNGTAEIISINVDKEFRSNFICEHNALQKTIEELILTWEEKGIEDNYEYKFPPINFYFVDDSIITGGSFCRANSLIRSLISNEHLRYFSIDMFKGIFVLVDRLSESSKKSLIKDIGKFHYFLHLDISSQRAGGDSCVCCKLEEEAQILFKKSSTKMLADYWFSKIKVYRAKQFDSIRNDDEKFKSDAISLLLSQVAYKFLFDYNCHNNENEFFNSVCILIDIIFLENENNYSMNSDNRGNLINTSIDISIIRAIKMVEPCSYERFKKLIYVISRPFFTFDKSCKQAVLNFVLRFSCRLLNITIGDKENIPEKAATKIERVSDAYEKLNLLYSCVMVPLSDLKSNYILRKKVIISISEYIFSLSDLANNGLDALINFWQKYAAFVQASIDCTEDETKSLWFEYLLRYGDEYNKSPNSQSNYKSLFKSLGGTDLNKDFKKAFDYFCNELFLLNTSLSFKGLENYINRTGENTDYFLENWKSFRRLNSSNGVDINNSFIIKAEKRFMDELVQLSSQTVYHGNDESVEITNKYLKLINIAKNALSDKYHIHFEDICFTIVTFFGKKQSERTDYNKYDFVLERPSDDLLCCRNRYNIKSFIIKNFSNKKMNKLERFGYIISHQKELLRGAILFQNLDYIQTANDFDNSKKSIDRYMAYNVGRRMYNTAPVFLYFDIPSKGKSEIISALILRDILTYRNKIMSLVEKDFSSEAFGLLAHARDELALISHEKAMSHATTTDDAIQYKVLTKPTVQLPSINDVNFLGIATEIEEENEKLKYNIFKSYVDRQIGKLYCRIFSNTNNKKSYSNRNNIPLYVVGSEDSSQPVDKQFMYRKVDNLADFFLDQRYLMLKELSTFEVVGVENAVLFSWKNKCFNKEFLFCVLFDILFSALRYSSHYNFSKLIEKRQNKKHYEVTIKPKIEIKIYRESQYLVICNSVCLGNDTALISDFEDRNWTLKARLNDHIDFPDGHMSLLTIKKYIEGLNNVGKCTFEYKLKEHDPTGIYTKHKQINKVKSLFFETRLPIFKNKE